jgi:hypothetical protein
LAEAQEGRRVVLFMDAAHFIHTVYLGFLWCFHRIYLKSPSGRQRFNVLGCLDAVTHRLHSFTNEGYINALSVCELLTQVAAFYGPSLPITIFLDNAKYQRCELVRQHAQRLGIELEFLPSYSPNLNPQLLTYNLEKVVVFQAFFPKSGHRVVRTQTCPLFENPMWCKTQKNT